MQVALQIKAENVAPKGGGSRRLTILFINEFGSIGI